ncbi:hypothetical protein HY251_14480, partial [bacterium]|nr:hypothetical protein [bacterium]
EFRSIVRDLRSAGKTIIVSSHILTELADFCDAVGIVEKGRMLVSGKIDDIQKRLDPTTRLDLEVLGDTATARTILAARTEIARVEAGEQPGILVARGKLGPDPASVRAEILASLVGAGVRVASFSARRDGLEDLFLRVAADASTGDRARRGHLATLGGAEEPVSPPPRDERTVADIRSPDVLPLAPAPSPREADAKTRLAVPGAARMPGPDGELL